MVVSCSTYISEYSDLEMSIHSELHSTTFLSFLSISDIAVDIYQKTVKKIGTEQEETEVTNSDCTQE